MKTYEIRLIAMGSSIAVIFLSLIIVFATLLISLQINPPPSNGFEAVIGIIIALIDLPIIYFLWQRIVVYKTNWIIDSEKIQVVRTKEFNSDNMSDSDVTIKWNEIAKISKGADPNYYILKFKLVSGEKIRFIHSTIIRDDFNQLLETLNTTLKEKNKTRFE